MIRRIKILTIVAIFISSLMVIVSSCDLKDEIDDALEDVATSIVVVSGESQTGLMGDALENPIVIQVRDQGGDPFEGATVNFAVEEGSVSPASATTDANGEASLTWKLGIESTSQILTVTSLMADGETELYGSPLSVYATATIPTVTDIDGNVYRYVTIGSQKWMAENLKVTRYSDGTEIQLVTDNTEWADPANYTANAFCYVNNDVNSDYGAFYTWAAATNNTSSTTNPSGIQGACPTGWHIPSKAEWDQLVNELGGTSNAGIKLKETGTEHWWASQYEEGTNESGFTALPAGYRSTIHEGEVVYQKQFANFTSATADDYYFVTTFKLSHDSEGAEYGDYQKANGLSVRCVKD